MNIYVSNLALTLSNEELKKQFTVFGEVVSADIITDKFTNRSRGFAFVVMRDQRAAEKAIRELNGAMINGRTVRLVEAAEKDKNGTRSL
jgi:RNA recognition motif-containing protein